MTTGTSTADDRLAARIAAKTEALAIVDVQLENLREHRARIEATAGEGTAGSTIRRSARTARPASC